VKNSSNAFRKSSRPVKRLLDTGWYFIDDLDVGSGTASEAARPDFKSEGSVKEINASCFVS